MIQFKLKQLIADKEFRDGCRITLTDVAKEAGVHRITLSRISNVRGYSVSTDVIERICRYLGCSVSEFMEIVPDSEVSQAPVTRRAKESKRKSKRGKSVL